MSLTANKYSFEIIGKDKTEKTFNSIRKNLDGVADKAGKIGAAAFTGAVVGGAALIKTTLNANVEMIRLADSIGVSSQAMSEWSYAGSTVNITAEKMADIFKDVQEKIGYFAATGGGEAGDVLKNLNLDIEEMIKLKPDEQLLKIAEGLEKVGTQGEKSFYLEALASDATYLLPLLDNGAAKLKALQQEAREFGVSISELDATKMKLAERSLERVWAIWSGFANTLTIEAAPIIESVSEQIVGLGKDSGDMGEKIRGAFWWGARGVGVFQDGLHGAKIIMTGAELVANTLATGMSQLAVITVESASAVYNAVLEGIFTPLRSTLELMSNMPGKMGEVANSALGGLNGFVDDFTAKVPEALTTFRDAQASAMEETMGRLQSLLAADLPSDVLMANIETVMTEADQKIRERIAEIKKENGAGDGEDEAERLRFETRLARLSEQWMTEQELLQQKYQKDQQLLEEALQKEYLLDAEYWDKRDKLKQSYDKKMQMLDAKKNQAIYGSTISALNSLLNATDSNSKKSFEQKKNLSVALASASLPSAVMQSYENGGGYPWGIIPAGIMAVKGIAEIAKIKKTRYKGGGGYSKSSGGGGSGGASPGSALPSALNNTPVPQSPQDQQVAPITNFIFNGDISSNDADRLIGDIKDRVNNGDLSLIDPNSRNGQELRGGA